MMKYANETKNRRDKRWFDVVDNDIGAPVVIIFYLYTLMQILLERCNMKLVTGRLSLINIMMQLWNSVSSRRWCCAQVPVPVRVRDIDRKNITFVALHFQAVSLYRGVLPKKILLFFCYFIYGTQYRTNIIKKANKRKDRIDVFFTKKIAFLYFCSLCNLNT